ncbi:MAG: siphovirus Gp157 family protein [Clostridiales bacterium]|nr:siphovirus Gp157 family protein [Clostridiales bacterium]
MKLYEYDEILESLYRAQESEDGVDGETGMVFDISLLDELEMARDKKIENALLYSEQLKADAKAIDDYIKDRQAVARAKKNAADSIKQWLIARMREKGESKFETKRIRALLRITAGNKTVITDEKIIPPQYLKIKKEPDTTAIKAAIKAGEEVPGAMLVDSVSLTVK